MVSLHSIFCGCLLISRPEKKLAIALKSFLALEAIAKVVFIVKDNLTEKGTLLHPCALIYSTFTVVCSGSWSPRCELHIMCGNR